MAERAFIVYSCEACGRRVFSERRLLGSIGVCPVCGKEGRVGGVLAVGAPGSGGHPQVPQPAAGNASGGLRPGDHSGGYGPGSQSGGYGNASGPIAAGNASGPYVLPDGQVIPEPIPVNADERRGAPRFGVENASLQVESAAKGAGLWEGLRSYEVHDISTSGVCVVTAGPEDKKAIRGYRPPGFKIGEEVGITLHLPGTFRPLAVHGKIARVDQVGRKNEFQVGIAFANLTADAKAELRRLAKKHAGPAKP